MKTVRKTDLTRVVDALGLDLDPRRVTRIEIEPGEVTVTTRGTNVHGNLVHVTTLYLVVADD